MGTNANTILGISALFYSLRNRFHFLSAWATICLFFSTFFCSYFLQKKELRTNLL